MSVSRKAVHLIATCVATGALVGLVLTALCLLLSTFLRRRR
ncbi:hypothetical protein [Streptomyces mirabilis]